MTLARLFASTEGASRLPAFLIRIGRGIGALFVSLFLSSLSRDERERQRLAGEAPVFNAPPGDDDPWPACMFDQFWPR